MEDNSSHLMRKIIMFLNRNIRILVFISIILMLPAIYFFVYYTGGIKYVFSHTMYIPIILAGIFFGPKFGFLIGLCAGIILGPLMPLEISTNEPQLFINWSYRLVIFISIGIISGYTSSRLRKNATKIKDLMSMNQETHIPNTNYLSRCDELLAYKPQTVMTLLIVNHTSIINVLGTDIYYQVLFEIYQDLMQTLPKKSMVIQSGSNKFWIIKPYEDLEKDSKLVISLVHRTREVDQIPLYIESAIGTSVVTDYNRCQKLSCYRASDASARLAETLNLPYVIYDDNLVKSRHEYELLASFAKALKENQTFLVYQPKINLTTMLPVGLEALIRWEHPQKGLIMPDAFIPLIEQTKLIHLLTDWVLHQALLKILEFQEKGLTVEISINISAKNLSDPTFFDRMIGMIEQMNVPKRLIEFEITESVLMVNPEESKALLNKFSSAGIKIAIDDFGKGYSSLAYLSQFPIHVIKIDKFFMKQIVDNVSAQQIVKATIDLAKKLGYLVLAEGIEDELVMKIMQDYKCDLAQGYYFAKPMSGDAIMDWYQKHLSS